MGKACRGGERGCGEFIIKRRSKVGDMSQRLRGTPPVTEKQCSVIFWEEGALGGLRERRGIIGGLRERREDPYLQKEPANTQMSFHKVSLGETDAGGSFVRGVKKGSGRVAQ